MADITDFDTPEERQEADLRRRKAAVEAVLKSPAWAVYLEYLQDCARRLLDVILYAADDNAVREARGSLRTLVEIGRDFGVADLQLEGALLDISALARAKRDQYEQIAAQQRRLDKEF